MLHGLASSPQEFGLIARSIRAKGVQLHLPEVAGYSALDRRRISAWRDWVRSAVEPIEREVPHDEPIVLGGLCAGGFLAAAVAMQIDRRVQGLAMLSPALAFDGWGVTPWCRVRHVGYGLGLGRYISIAERPPYGVKNQRIRDWIEREMRTRSMSAAGPSRLTLWALREGERLTAHVDAHMAKLDQPLLVIHARQDEITTFKSVERIFGRWPQRDKRLVALENSYHMITIDNDRHRVVDELVMFLERAAVATTQRSRATVPVVHSLPTVAIPCLVSRPR